MMKDWFSDFSTTKIQNKTGLIKTDEQLWNNKYAPSSQLELVVHKKKILELEDWLKNVSTNHKKTPSILLMTGPTGTGKTITLQTLAKELKFDVQEWINPVTSEIPWQKNFDEDFSFPSSKEMVSESQSTKFADFLLRTNRYPTLDIFGSETIFQRKLILVEDFPNIFLKETSKFHDILRSYSKRGICPLVFILSDNDRSVFSENVLFPKELQSELKINCIRFNPVAPTSMIKVLTRIASVAASQNRTGMIVPEKEILDEIILSSDGDIRSAVNVLQFFCLNNVKKLSTSKKTKFQTVQKSGTKRTATKKERFSTNDTELSTIGLKDTSLSLFRALGKILHCKRIEGSLSSSVMLPTHLSNLNRDSLVVDPEDVFEKSQMSPESYSAFLHQNYLEFYKNLDDVVMASEYFSDAECFVREWSTKSALQNYYASVVTRGLLFCNVPQTSQSSATSTGPGWKPLHKPQLFSTAKRFRDNCEDVRYTFRMNRLNVTEFATQFSPYLTYLNLSDFNAKQRSLISEVGRFMSRRCALEKLDEKEVVTPEELETDMIDGKPNAEYMSNDDGQSEVVLDGHVSPDFDNDDLNIEDFDD